MSKIILFLDECNNEVITKILYYPEDKFKTNAYRLTGDKLKGVFTKSKLLISRIKQAHFTNYKDN